MAAAISGAMGGGRLAGFGGGGGGGGWRGHAHVLRARAELAAPPPAHRAAHTDLLRVPRPQANATASTLEHRTRLASALRMHAHPRAGAATLAPSELQAMQADLAKLQGAVEAAKGTVTNERAPLPPPDGPELRGSASHPLFERLCGLPSVEALAGEGREPPVVLPVRLSCVPDQVTRSPEPSP